MATKIMMTLLTLALVSCGGGSEGGNNAGGNEDDHNSADTTFLPREEREDVPVEHEGLVTDKSRFYARSANGFGALVNVSGLDGELRLLLNNQEALDIEANGSFRFGSTFLGGTEVSVSIATSPNTQDCQITGSATQIIQSDSMAIFDVECSNTNAPPPPVIELVYSGSQNTIEIQWTDIDEINSDQSSYRILLSENENGITDGTATLFDIEPGNSSRILDGLLSNQDYFIAMQAVSEQGIVSELSTTARVRTNTDPVVLKNVTRIDVNLDEITISDSTWTIPIDQLESAPSVGDYLIGQSANDVQIVLITQLISEAENYIATVEAAGLGDLIQSMSISSNLSVDIFSTTPSAQAKGEKPSSTSSEKSQRLPFNPSLCRSFTGELSDTELNQITVELNTAFNPRVQNDISFDYTNAEAPSIFGSIMFEGDIELSLGIGFEITAELEGQYTCRVLEIPKTLVYSIGGVPVLQRVTLTADVILVLKSELNLEANVKQTTRMTINAGLEYDEESSTWSPVAEASEHTFSPKMSLDYAARLNSQLSLVPKIETTFYESARVDMTFKADANARAEIRVLSTNDPSYEFRNNPFLLTDFSADVKAEVSMSADFTLFGHQLFALPKQTLYDTGTARIFDLPKLCISPMNDSETCSDFKKISRQSSRRYELEIFLYDGVNNPADLNSIQWQVSPPNGILEIDPEDPRKIIFEAYDDGAYTIVVSSHGVLGRPARQYATFILTGEDCQYGLGEPMPDQYEQYFEIGKGYLIPNNVTEPNNLLSFYETCEFYVGDNEIRSPDTVRAEEVNLRVEFYGGKRNGLLRFGDSIIPQHKIRQGYQNGNIINHLVTIEDFTGYVELTPSSTTPYGSIITYAHENEILGYGRLITVTNPLEYASEPLEVEAFFNPSTLISTVKRYYLSGNLHSSFINNFQYELKEELIFGLTSVLNDPIGIPERGTPISSEHFHEDGAFAGKTEAGEWTRVCGWLYWNSEDSIDYSRLEDEPNTFARLESTPPGETLELGSGYDPRFLRKSPSYEWDWYPRHYGQSTYACADAPFDQVD